MPRYSDELRQAIESILDQVSSLERKIAALKVAANTLADASELPLPYPELRPKHEPMPWELEEQYKPAAPDEPICGSRLWVNDRLHAVCVRVDGHNGDHCGVNAPGHHGVIWPTRND